MAIKKYRKLRTRMVEMDVDQGWIAQKMGCTRAYISNRFCGKSQWTVNEAYQVCRLLKIQLPDMIDYFPEGGDDAVKSLRAESAYKQAEQKGDTPCTTIAPSAPTLHSAGGAGRFRPGPDLQPSPLR